MHIILINSPIILIKINDYSQRILQTKLRGRHKHSTQLTQDIINVIIMTLIVILLT